MGVCLCMWPCVEIATVQVVTLTLASSRWGDADPQTYLNAGKSVYRQISEGFVYVTIFRCRPCCRVYFKNVSQVSVDASASSIMASWVVRRLASSLGVGN